MSKPAAKTAEPTLQTASPTADAAPKKRRHTAHYSRDKMKGGWLVSVIGPDAEKFANREIPVRVMGQDEEQLETLTKLIWSGPSTLEATAGQNSALYSFKQRERKVTSVEF
jgi:hypothetical protein